MNWWKKSSTFFLQHYNLRGQYHLCTVKNEQTLKSPRESRTADEMMSIFYNTRSSAFISLISKLCQETWKLTVRRRKTRSNNSSGLPLILYQQNQPFQLIPVLSVGYLLPLFTVQCNCALWLLKYLYVLTILTQTLPTTHELNKFIH